MPTRQDILFTKIAMKNQLLSLDQIKKCLTIQGELEQVGVHKPIGEVFQENGYLVEEDILRLNKALKLTEQLLQEKLAKKNFFQELKSRKEEIVENIFDEKAWEKEEIKPEPKKTPPPREKTGNPFEMETEVFQISPEGELEAVMLLQQLRKVAAQTRDDLEERFGKFKILSKLGQGGQSEVFRALDTITQMEVALKIIKPDIAKDKEFIERFHRETKHLKKFDHPNIIKIFDAGMIQDRHYLAMEYVKGETLSDRAVRGRISIPEVGEIIKQIVQGLLAAHEKLIVHRDIKMSNILLSTDSSKYGFEMEGEANFRVKIADFGLARSKKDTKITQANQFMGTAKYLAPEQIQHGELSEKCDIFSLGIIVYELLTGEEPFKATSSIGYLHANVEDTPVMPRSLNSDISESLEGFTMKILEKNPRNRYDTPALMRDLERLEKTFWGNQKILEYFDEESVFYVGYLEERKKRIKRIILGSLIALVLISSSIALRLHLNKSQFELGRRLLKENPKTALKVLEESRGWGVDDAEVDKLIYKGNYKIHILKAKEAEGEERWLQAIQIYQDALKKYPQHAQYLKSRLRFGQYKILMTRGEEMETTDLLKAAKIYQEAIKVAPDQKEARANLEALVLKLDGDIQKYKDLKKYERARNLLKIKAKIISFPSFDLEMSKLELEKILMEAKEMEDSAKWLEAYGKYEKALDIQKKLQSEKSREYQRILKRQKKTYVSYLFHIQKLKGEKAEREGKFEKALTHYRKALNLRRDPILRDHYRRLQERIKKSQ